MNEINRELPPQTPDVREGGLPDIYLGLLAVVLGAVALMEVVALGLGLFHR